MKNLSDIKYRIKGISQTRQITGAMETISVAKMRRALQRFNGNQAYFNKTREIIAHIVRHSGGVEHRYWKPKGGGRAVYIVIAGDKGLAGGYNGSVLNFAWKTITGDGHTERSIFTVGQVAREFFERKRVPIEAEFMHAANDPTLKDAAAIVDNIVGLYEKDRTDGVYIVYTGMENSSTMRPEVIRLLPLAPAEAVGGTESGADKDGNFGELYYDPSPEEVLETLVPQYLIAVVYGCLIQSAAGEHSSRVLAMSNATKNADDILDHLNVVYHRARQEAVTNEMLEIITSANSVN